MARFWADSTSLGVVLDDHEPDMQPDQGLAILDAAVAGMRRCFATASTPSGVLWPSLTPASQASKTRRGFGKRIGAETGNLIASLDRGEQDWGPRHATWAVPDDQAGKAEGFGSRRPFVGWSREAKDAALEILGGRG